MDPRGPLPGMDPRAGPGSGMDRGPPHRGGMDHRGMDSRGPPPSMDPRMDRRPGMDPRGKLIYVLLVVNGCISMRHRHLSSFYDE